jgi:hypothetical protein
MHDHLLLLSTKLVASLTGAVVSFMSTPIIAALENTPSWVAEYGALGAMCGFLIYALRVMHTINQNLQKDWRDDRRKAEAERLADRDTFYDKLTGLFEKNDASRDKLVESFERLTESVEHSCKKHSEALEQIDRAIKNQIHP